MSDFVGFVTVALIAASVFFIVAGLMWVLLIGLAAVAVLLLPPFLVGFVKGVREGRRTQKEGEVLET